MVISGTVKCDNCSTSLALKWVQVKRAHRTHHADLECPLCGATEAMQAWLKSGQGKDKTCILLAVEAPH